MRKFLLRVIEAKYSVSTWLWVIVSALTVAIMGLQVSAGGEGVDSFSKALPIIEVRLWLVLLALSVVGSAIGMIINDRAVLGLTSFAAWVLWVFGFFGFLFVGQGFTVMLLIAPFIIFYAYLFLAALLRDNKNL